MAIKPVPRWFMCLLAVTCLDGVMCGWRITEEPMNTAVRLGESARLNCTVAKDSDQDALEWQEFQTNNGGEEKRIFTTINGKIEPGYRIEGEYNLIINQLTSEKAGRYRCRLLAEGVTGNAYVIGMRETRCGYTGLETKEEDEETTLMCEADYHSGPYNGILPPKMRWNAVNGQLATFNQTVANPEDKTKTTARFVANVTVDRRHDNAPFRCDLFFEHTAGMPGLAPAYTDSCVTQFKVTYKTKNIRIYPDPDDFEGGIIKVEVNDHINCTGDGNPAPDLYEWKEQDGNDFLAGHILRITVDMVGRDNKYRCTAKQSYKGIADVVVHKDITFRASHDTSAVAKSRVLSLLTLLLGIFVVTLCHL